MSLEAFVQGVGMLGPGLDGWPQAAAVLAQRCAYEPGPTVLPAPSILPATERRRSGRVVKLALAVASEALARAGAEAAALRSVFSSSGGDGHNCHEICQALALEPREVSPTRFSNSVHNAAAGYWSIATAATAASTVLCAFDASFCAGLLEALAQVSIDRQPVLLVTYDTEYPQPLHAKRPVPDAFGIALLLAPRRDARSCVRLEATLGAAPADRLTDERLEALRRAVPAARGLPLLAAIAGIGADGHRGAVLDYLAGCSVAVDVSP